MDNNTEDSTEKELAGLDRIIEKLGRLFSWGYLFIVLISFYEILARYIFNRPTEWVHETSIALAGFLMVYAGLFAYGRDKHIRVPVLLNVLPNKWKNRLEIFSKVLTLIFLILLSYSAYFVAEGAIFSPSGEILVERSGSAWNPPLPGFLKASVFIMSVLFTIQVTLKLIAHFTTNKGDK